MGGIYFNYLVSHMIEDSDETDSKRRILDAASLEFARNGFDGARVDTIAKRASVNKALIYYYFKSKDELLEVVCDETITEMIGFMKAETLQSLDLRSPAAMRTYLSHYLDQLEKKEAVIRVMLMESLKRSSSENFIFTRIRGVLGKFFELGQEAGYSMGQQGIREVMEFFTGIMPILNYVVYHNMWMERFGLTEPELRGQFLDSFIGTHIAFSSYLYGGGENGWIVKEGQQ